MSSEENGTPSVSTEEEQKVEEVTPSTEEEKKAEEVTPSMSTEEKKECASYGVLPSVNSTAGEQDDWGSGYNTTTYTNPQQAAPKQNAATLRINIYDTNRETAKVYTALGQFRTKAKTVKKEIAKQLGVKTKELFQCNFTMWCCLDSDDCADKWKFDGIYVHLVHLYLEWKENPKLPFPEELSKLISKNDETN